MAYENDESLHSTINPHNPDHLQDPLLPYARTDFPQLSESLTVEGALRIIRTKGLGQRIVYFYVVDEDGRLTGVLSTRGLLLSGSSVRLSEIMSRDIVSISHSANILQACEMFLRHKLLAFPVVDDDGKIVGVVDAGLFTQETMNFAEKQHVDDVFQIIGFGIAQIKGRSPFGIFRFRFPWLLATMASGTICAVLTGFYEATLSEAIVLAFFITLVLALGESVSIQSMTVTIQNLHFRAPGLSLYLRWLRQEGMATSLLGLACGTIVGSIAYLWRGSPEAALIIGLSVLVSVFSAGVIGMSIPTLLHAIHEDSKIAAGPITLALTDILTLIFYFNIAVFVLR
ncbi:MAG TPA: CBS domain-containing protein [Pyrinomonadaceae bacterium]|nr:CBS domain-containing protein [Pyrinomonadaceae bacterium]HMP64719.1 CBS domain-containing protein [Pyrinomonadaceae bacterium]